MQVAHALTGKLGNVIRAEAVLFDPKQRVPERKEERDMWKKTKRRGEILSTRPSSSAHRNQRDHHQAAYNSLFRPFPEATFGRPVCRAPTLHYFPLPFLKKALPYRVEGRGVYIYLTTLVRCGRAFTARSHVGRWFFFFWVRTWFLGSKRAYYDFETWPRT